MCFRRRSSNRNLYFIFFSLHSKRRLTAHRTYVSEDFVAFFFADTFLICRTKTRKLIECTRCADFEFHLFRFFHGAILFAILSHPTALHAVGGLGRNYLFTIFFPRAQR